MKAELQIEFTNGCGLSTDLGEDFKVIVTSESIKFKWRHGGTDHSDSYPLGFIESIHMDIQDTPKESIKEEGVALE